MKVFKVVQYFESVIIAIAISQFRLHFPHNRTPDRSIIMIMRNANRYLTCSTSLNPKRPGHFWTHLTAGGILPPKILETDWRNIKCVELVDSYDPPESIGTKKSTNIPCMTSQWHHKWRHVKNTKITKNRQNHGFSLFFQAKVAFFGNDVCQSTMYAYTCSYSK